MALHQVSGTSRQRLDVVASAGVFLFFAMMLSVPRGYTLGAVVLLLGGLYYMLQRPSSTLSGEDKLMVWLLIGMSAMGVFSYLYHDNPMRSLDLVSRYILVVPILLWLIKRPPNAEWMWAGLIVGSISAAGVTLWQVYVLDFDRARGTTGVIQYGDLNLIMGVFCAAGLISLRRTAQGQTTVWSILLALAAIAGVYSSIESGSRGGWIALPAIVAVFVVAYTSRRNVKYVIAAVLLLLAAALAAITTVPAVEARYDEAVSDIQRYQAGDPQTSLGYRLDMYKSLSIIIPQKPWLGWSLHDYKIEQERLVSSGIVSDVLFKMPNTHNTFLEFWVLHGLLGLLTLLALLLVAFVYFARRLRDDNKRIQTAAVCGTALIVGYGVFSLSQVMLNRNNTLLFFLIAVVVFWAMAKPAATDGQSDT